MAENTSNVTATVPLETGDDLSETQLRGYIAQTSLVDYVIRGMGFSADFGANTLTIGNTNTRGNFAVLTDSNLAYPVFPDQATGISLPDTNGVNYVFVQYDTGTDDQVTYVVNDTDATPTQPALKIGEVDTSTNSTTELNRSPDITVGGLSGTSIDNTDSPYTTQDEDIIFVDTSTAPVEVELASADVALGKQFIIVDDADNAGTNNITVSTEGSETINPDGAATKTVGVDGGHIVVWSDATNWESNTAFGSLTIGTATVPTLQGVDDLSGGITSSTSITDLVGNGLEIASNTLGVLTSIVNNGEVVGDVNNTNVTTTEINNDDYHESVTTASVTGATNVDLGSDNFKLLTLTGDTTFSFVNESTTPPGNSLYLELEQDGTGSHNVTWPAEVEWPSGVEPSLNQTATALNALTFTTHDGGTTWRGTVRGEDFR